MDDLNYRYSLAESEIENDIEVARLLKIAQKAPLGSAQREWAEKVIMDWKNGIY